ncbi:interleukin-1 receptor-associated kinase-like 2 isoform X1 [Antechinus flavipes]|uniref:interleukin-1 receptor-associated kinase-like 2 isoform X1 n=1 Tax=Antechinus flavipes TaxID=38775 RepID=UPI0022355AC9|nr:interleukin-1 receptor-associated kinase-like 2 isoform X1 [Antechinus flavipes]
MALQPPLLPPPPALRSPRTSRYIYQLPSWVLEDFCHKMDSLSEWDWMQFASYVMTDQTQLRKIKSMERIQGVSITRELLWWWGMRQATVQQLLDLLYRLQLYRAAQVILDWGAVPEIASASHVLPDSLPPEKSSVSSSIRKPEELQEQGPTKPSGLIPFSSSGPSPSGSTKQALHIPFIEEDLPHSLKTNPSASSDMKNCQSYIPQKKSLVSLNGESLYWTEMEVIKATNGFSQDNKISEGSFADVYKGQRHNMLYAFKKLQKTRCPRDISIESFFHMEVQICLRCSHPNILPLLGFCTGEVFHSVIHPYMPNGSLEDRLRCQDNTAPLSWEQRISISLGFLEAIEYLHGLKIIHGNIKSSNVLLERNFAPKLGHPRIRLSSDDKKSSYTMMNTQLFQALTAYVPEDFIRVGQLTERVDIFGCGIVLAEILTGIPAMDKERTPVYLKDLLISEIPSTKVPLCSKNKCVEKLAAKEICQKYQDARAGHLPEKCAVDFATAVYLCLQKKSPSLTQVRAAMAEVERQVRDLQGPRDAGSDWKLKRSGNTPEETDDVEDLGTECSSSDDHDEKGLWAGSECGESSLYVGAEAAFSGHPPAATENSWEVEINDAKKKLMENILLYEEQQLNSEELFGSFKP